MPRVSRCESVCRQAPARQARAGRRGRIGRWFEATGSGGPDDGPPPHSWDGADGGPLISALLGGLMRVKARQVITAALTCAIAGMIGAAHGVRAQAVPQQRTPSKEWPTY